MKFFAQALLNTIGSAYIMLNRVLPGVQMCDSYSEGQMQQLMIISISVGK